ncbi:MAG: polysaccharide biosynthesis protein, partial [Candidatus Omnitrophica bacterium]|nr:polysaccharide biosynthesis protein [Candidatus Omnitrophota bacterium]
ITTNSRFVLMRTGVRLQNIKYPIRYFLGDIRDRSRLNRAFEGVDCVVHAAALKQVPALEYNPMEAVKTNILGADNIVEAAIDQGVAKVVALSTDKASNPINLYGATKLAAEKVFTAANSYAGGRVKFSTVRYGNVMGSRGSVVPFFLSLKEQGVSEFPITDDRMTRFWITLDQSVDLVMKALNFSVGGECFVPIIPSMRVIDLAKAIDPQVKFKIIGIRPGEKLHESLVSEDEGYNTKIFQNTYVILPQFFNNKDIHRQYDDCPKVPEGFIYRSDLNKQWVTMEKMKEMLKTSV